MKTLHLICNSHIDPIWLWEWEEGASVAVSTFRSAANLADEFDYVFNHNEVTLYKWIEEYEPELFERIKALVKAGKWHIMGGWYLQPDCNMPSGESLVRQAMKGREYFEKHFGVKPKTAMNVDPFGHSVGLVQILKKCGYDSYLFCRPYPQQLELPDDRFIWQGPDGSTVKCFRSSAGYLTLFGQTANVVRDYISRNESLEVGMVLWGVGNHGGGPSRQDLRDIEALIAETDVKIIHSTPENYFAEFDDYKYTFSSSLYPSMVGCYTSMSQVKKLHRDLENLLFFTEKICSVASSAGLIQYPYAEIERAEEDLLNAEFHDILPGSSIKTGGEEAGIRKLQHGIEELTKVRAKAFFALSNGFDRVEEEAYPIFVFNPHPYETDATVDCEFMLANQNWENDFTFFTAYDGDKALPSQIIQEASNLNLDWRKHILFDCKLKPLSMNRFYCVPYKVNKKPEFPPIEKDFVFTNEYYTATIGCETGFLKSLVADGTEYLNGQAFVPTLTDDTDDPWGSSSEQNIRLGKKADTFRLMTPEEGSVFSGLKGKVIPSLRIIEDGDVATIVEGVFSCRSSFIRTQYTFYKHRRDFDVSLKVFWNEKSMALKLAVPLSFCGKYYGDIPFGYEELPTDGKEVPSQKWTAIKDDRRTFSIINNCIYGSSCEGGTLLPTLLRSPAYSALPLDDPKTQKSREILRGDRFTDRMDQGERSFSFNVFFGDTESTFADIPRKAALFNEKPFALNIYPSGNGKIVNDFVTVDNSQILLSCLKYSENGELIMRLYNNSDKSCSANVYMNGKIAASLTFGKFEVKTLKKVSDCLVECEQMEI